MQPLCIFLYEFINGENQRQQRKGNWLTMQNTTLRTTILRTIFSFGLGIASIILGVIVFIQPSNDLQAKELNLSMSAVSCSSGSGNVTGTVFRDFDADGVIDATEVGVAGITVTAYSDNGIEAMCLTDSAGMYTLTVGVGDYPLRIEATGIPSYLESGTSGSDSETTVTFVTADTAGVDIGLNNPSDYCQSNPDLATTCFVNGDPNHASTPEDVVVAFPYSASGTDAGLKSTVVTKSEAGSVWGMAYKQDTKELFTAAFLKRHVGLGSAGLGGIYLTDLDTNTTSVFLDLAIDLSIDVGTIPTNAARGVGAPTEQ